MYLTPPLQKTLVAHSTLQWIIRHQLLMYFISFVVIFSDWCRCIWHVKCSTLLSSMARITKPYYPRDFLETLGFIFVINQSTLTKGVDIHHWKHEERLINQLSGLVIILYADFQIYCQTELGWHAPMHNCKSHVKAALVNKHRRRFRNNNSHNSHILAIIWKQCIPHRDSHSDTWCGTTRSVVVGIDLCQGRVTAANFGFGNLWISFSTSDLWAAGICLFSQGSGVVSSIYAPS